MMKKKLNFRKKLAVALAVAGVVFLGYALYEQAWWHLALFPCYMLFCGLFYYGDGDNEPNYYDFNNR